MAGAHPQKQTPSSHNPSNSMETEEPSDTHLEVEPNPKLLLRTNRLAKISMFIWIGTTIGNIFMYSAADYDWMTVIFLSSLVLVSVFGAFCGHCSCGPEAGKPHTRVMSGMAAIGIIGCYLCIICGLFLIFVLFQGTV